MSIDLPKMPSQHHHYLGMGRVAKNGYTEDQMREYAQEAARLALEAAAICKACALGLLIYHKSCQGCQERLRRIAVTQPGGEIKKMPHYFLKAS